MVVTGDVTQIDLPTGARSGLKVIREILAEVDDIAFIDLSAQDVVRNSLVGDIVEAYGKFDQERQLSAQEQRQPRQLRPSN